MMRPILRPRAHRSARLPDQVLAAKAFTPRTRRRGEGSGEWALGRGRERPRLRGEVPQPGPATGSAGPEPIAPDPFDGDND